MNDLSVAVYLSGTTLIKDPAGELELIESLRFSIGYPGGRYLNASMFVPRDVVQSWLVEGAQRFVIRNGLTTVWEGAIGNLERILRKQDQGIKLNSTGYWGTIMLSRRICKRWADQRITESIWPRNRVADIVEDHVNIQRDDRLRIVPYGGIVWGDDDMITVRYTMPTGETISRITFDYDLHDNNGGQSWKIRISDTTNGEIWGITAQGTGSEDHEPGTPVQHIDFDFFNDSGGDQTVPVDQTTATDAVYGEISAVIVYSETGNIDLLEITKDIRAALGDLNADENHIDSNTLDLTPFIADRFETYGGVLARAASFGDSSQNRWAYGLLSSEDAATPDGKPVLFVEQFPVLTDYDYAIRLDEENVVPSIAFTQDFIGSGKGKIWNWIIVQYTDEEGVNQFVTPDDDADLTDATSITDYGQRDYLLRVGHATVTEATNFGRRLLAASKDPAWRVKSPIKVQGHIRGKSGNLIPSSEIRAGKRLKIENFLQDLSGTGLTLLITKTDYRDKDETCKITTGQPGSLDVFLAQQALRLERAEIRA